MKTLFITGASGFVGTELCKIFLKKKWKVKALVRSEERAVPGTTPIVGGISEINNLSKSLQDVDMVVNLLGIIREIPSENITFRTLHVEATENLLKISKKMGIERFLQISANGSENQTTPYQKTKYEAEKMVEESGLNYTIFKPSLIYGSQDKFINMLKDKIRLYPLFPYFGEGSYLLQPISVKEVADIFFKSTDNENTFLKTFNICGKDILTYKQLLQLIVKTLGIRRVLFPMPEILVDIATILMGKFSFFPITRDQFRMLKQGNVCKDNSIQKILNIEQRDIVEELNEYLK